MSDATQKTQRDRASTRRRRKLIGLGLIIALVSAVAIPVAMAHRGPLSDEDVVERAERMLERVLDKIDATEAQEAEAQAILDKVLPQALELREAAREVREGVREALMAEQPDAERLEALRQRGLKLADEGSKLAFDALLEVHQILTPEQRAEIREFTAKFAGRHHHR